MKNDDGVTYSSYQYLGFLDADFKVLWCDYPRLYKLLSGGSKKLLKRIRNSESQTMFIHEMCFEGYRYKVFVNRLPQNSFSCRIIEEIPESLLKMDELFEFIDDVKNSTLDIYSMLKMLDEYSRDFNLYKDEFHIKIKEVRKKTGDIFSDCYGILKAFEENDCKYIPFVKYIIRTLDVIHFVTRKLKNKVAVDIDVVYPYIKIDYSKFELAFYNLIKIMLINLSDKSNSFLKVNDTYDDKIEITAFFPRIKEITSDKFDPEVRSIKHILRSMGGHFELCESENIYHAYGIFDVERSTDPDLIEKGYNIRYVGSPQLIQRRNETGRYSRIYEIDNESDNFYFSSNVAELSDIEDSDISFAEMFFEDLLQ